MRVISDWSCCFGCLLAASLLMLASVGCKKKEVASTPPAETLVADQSEPDAVFEFSEVELSEPKLRVDKDGVCWFEVKYKFVKGRLGENYLLSLNFPGTQNACVKQIAGWQLEGPEGTIKDGIPLQEQPISEFEFVMSEAEVPQNGYTQISNVLKGRTDG